MPTLKKLNIFNSEEGVEIEQILQLMSADKIYNTESSYSANADKYPNNRMPFVDKHMHYLNSHPGIDPKLYIANLRLITRIRIDVSRHF